jgi:RHH-type proline utilization regulon transcriptional repressor/proline dehydrogenase/delta 1-pyrroline-5-carboxylate dehydrogenase
VADIVSSAFDSAGQRCSALRLLCVQEEAADRLLHMLRGAVQELRLGDPRELATDIGPVIDAEAAALIESHLRTLQARGRSVWRPAPDASLAASLTTSLTTQGSFVAPAIVELASVAELEREVFGPVLHVLRYQRDRLAQTLEQINATGYGLTQGVHTRIDETVAQVVGAARAGNLYVNRNVVGAVVGVQPFGGEGLSGTGPKAGGPLYLLRLLARRPAQAAGRAVAHQGVPALPPVRGLDHDMDEARPAEGVAALRTWAQSRGMDPLAAHCDRVISESPVGGWRALPGPTGEANLYAVQARPAVLCLADDDLDRLAQLAAVLAVGSRAVWPLPARALFERLPPALREPIALAQDWQQPAVHFDAVLQHGDATALLHTAAALAERPGPIVGLTGLVPGDWRVPLERLVIERSLSINTAAAGGNASLMTIG